MTEGEPGDVDLSSDRTKTGKRKSDTQCGPAKALATLCGGLAFADDRPLVLYRQG
jgi:hypothetical protein